MFQTHEGLDWDYKISQNLGSLINRILHEIELNVNIWIVKTSVLRKKQNLYQVFSCSLKYDNLDYYHNLIHENRS